jgi:hypothetical protein
MTMFVMTDDGTVAEIVSFDDDNESLLALLRQRKSELQALLAQPLDGGHNEQCAPCQAA